jgi:hypothetical protein
MRGPFSVFPISTSASLPQSGGDTESVDACGVPSCWPSLSPQSATAGFGVGWETSPVSYASGHSLQSSRNESAHDDYNEVASDSLQPELSSTTAARQWRENLPVITVPSGPDHESPDHGDIADAQRSPENRPRSPIHHRGPSLMRNVSLYPMPMPQIELVHHWVTFVSGNLLLIDTPDNPCRTIYVPIALKGVDSSHVEFSMHRTVFHALCSASAFSLYHLRHDERYQSLALTHDQLALHHLRHNLGRASDANEPALAAVLSCVTAEAISGRRHRWRTHLLGALALLEKGNDAGWARDPTISTMLQSYLSLSSLCSLRVSTQLVSILDVPPEASGYLERSHGMTRPLVRFLASLIELDDSNAQLTADDLDGLELQLYLSFPRLSTPETQNAKVIQHAVNAFYYATVIYFRRTLRRVPSAAVQDLVEPAVENLEAVESYSQGKGGTAYNWPGMVVAAECLGVALQDRMLTWFQRKRRHGLQSIDVIQNLVTLLWQRREAAPSDADFHWQDIAKEADFDIMLV